MEKTSIMLIGPREPVGDEIQSLGFKFVDRISMLGVVITNNFNDIYSNFEKNNRKDEEYRLILGKVQLKPEWQNKNWEILAFIVSQLCGLLSDA